MTNCATHFRLDIRHWTLFLLVLTCSLPSSLASRNLAHPVPATPVLSDDQFPQYGQKSRTSKSNTDTIQADYESLINTLHPPAHAPNAVSATHMPNSVHPPVQHGVESDTHRCEPISLVLCKGMYYEYTRMPNIFHHETQEEAGLEAHQFYPLVQINCSKDLRFLLCSIYTPICIHGYPHFLPPCRSVCERVRAGCAPIMLHYAFPWPERMNCDQFPEYMNSEGILCMERNLTQEEMHSSQHVESPANQRTTPVRVDHLTSLTEPDQMVLTSMDLVQSLGEKFNSRASQILMDLSLRDPVVQKAKLTNPDLNLKCSCGCKPPLVRVDQGGKNGNKENVSVAGIPNCAMPCRSYYFSFDPMDKFTIYWLGIWSGLCALSTLITLLTFVTDSKRFQYPELPIIYLSICHLFISLGYLVRIWVGHDPMACDLIPNMAEPELNRLEPFAMNFIQELELGSVSSMPSLVNDTTHLGRLKSLRYASTGKTQCAVVFLLVYYFSMASSMWWVVLTFTWLLAAGFKWGSEAISKYSQVFHFVAWSTPACQTTLAFLLGDIEGNSISGLCELSPANKWPFILNLFLPIIVYLVLGSIFLMTGFIALFRIRDVIKLQRTNLVKTHKLDKLMIRIGIFGMIYTIPNLTILFCLGYEIRDQEAWQLGMACSCHFDHSPNTLEWKLPQPEYAVFMLKYFMYLMIGITSGFWIWSSKTIQRWKRLCCYANYCSRKFGTTHTGLLVNTRGMPFPNTNIHQTHRLNSITNSPLDMSNSNKYDIELWRQMSNPLRTGTNGSSYLVNGRRSHFVQGRQRSELSSLIQPMQLSDSSACGFHSYDVVIPTPMGQIPNETTTTATTYYSVNDPSWGQIVDSGPYQSGPTPTLAPTQASSFNPGFSTTSSMSSPNRLSALLKPTNGSGITRLSSSGIGSSQPNDVGTRNGSLMSNPEPNDEATGRWSKRGLLVETGMDGNLNL